MSSRTSSALAIKAMERVKEIVTTIGEAMRLAKGIRNTPREAMGITSEVAKILAIGHSTIMVMDQAISKVCGASS